MAIFVMNLMFTLERGMLFRLVTFGVSDDILVDGGILKNDKLCLL